MDEDLFNELAELTRKGEERCRKAGWAWQAKTCQSNWL
jgi:hypothetical protein